MWRSEFGKMCRLLITNDAGCAQLCRAAFDFLRSFDKS